MGDSTMEMLLYISASLALLALGGVFIYLIVFIRSTKSLLGAVTSGLQTLIGEITALRTGLQGTITNLEGIVGKMQTTMDRVNGQLDQVEGIVGNVKDVTTDATEVVHGAKNIVVNTLTFVDNLQTAVQRPLNEVAAVISALGAWLEAFRSKLGLQSAPRRAPLDHAERSGRTIEPGAHE